MIDLLGIKTESGAKDVRLLSGGNQQKVVLGRWLLHGADVFISSDLPELLTICDRLVVLREGVSVAELDCEGTTEDDILQHCYPGAAETA